MIYSVGSLLLMASLIGACRVESGSPGSQTTFAVALRAREDIAATYTLLRGGRAAVCIGLVGIPKSSDAGQKRAAMAVEALKGWHALLKESPDWPGKEPLEVNSVVMETECPNSYKRAAQHATFNFNYYKDLTTKIAYNCKNNQFPAGSWFCNPRTSANTGVMEYRGLFMSNTNRGREVPDADLRIETFHELGHALGLGDTYVVQSDGSSRKRPGQVESVMSTYSARFTADDRLGIWAAERYARTGRRDCSGFPVNGKNDYGDDVCEPSSQVLSWHPVPEIR